jgi:hypothetical protein
MLEVRCEEHTAESSIDTSAMHSRANRKDGNAGAPKNLFCHGAQSMLLTAKPAMGAEHDKISVIVFNSLLKNCFRLSFRAERRISLQQKANKKRDPSGTRGLRNDGVGVIQQAVNGPLN